MRNSLMYVMIVVMLFITIQPILADTTFKIQDYIPEKFKDLSWTIKGGMNGSTSNSSNSRVVDIIDSQYYKTNYSSYRFSLNSVLDYMKISLQEQLNLSLSASTQFDIYTSKSYENNRNDSWSLITRIENYTNSRKFYNIQLYPRIDYKRYIQNEKFYNININSTYQYRTYLKSESERDTYDYRNYSDSSIVSLYHVTGDQDSEDMTLTTTINAMLGDGRKEVGRYAFLAYNIVEELRNNNFLFNEPDRKTMIAFSDVLYQTENKHAIDSRVKEIEKFQEVYMFLEEHNIVNPNQPLGLLYIQDAYMIYPHELRSFGFVKTIGLGLDYREVHNNRSSRNLSTRLEYTYQNNTPEIIDTTTNGLSDSKTNSNRKVENLYKYIITEISYSNPLSMKWQIDTKVTGRYYFDSYVKPYYESYTQIKKRYDIDINTSIKYFYTSRTMWSTSLSYKYQRDKFGEFDLNVYSSLNENSKSWQFSLSTSLLYRLNMATTINGTIKYSNTTNDNFEGLYSDYSDDTIFSLSISLQHYIY